MNVGFLTVLIAMCVMSTHVLAKPQTQNAEAPNTGDQTASRSSSPRISNGGEPIYGITVVKKNGQLQPVFSNAAPTKVPPQDGDVTSTTECNRRDDSRCKRGSDIIFPTDADSSFVVPRGSTYARCLQGNITFCEDVEDYPTAVLDAILKKDKSQFDELFGEDMIVSNLNQRINGIYEEETLCRSIEKVIYPKLGLTMDNDWKYIVNRNNSTQGVRIELCESPETRCAHGFSFPNMYEPFCKQVYIYRQMVGLDEDGNIAKDFFKLPSCCQCVLRRVV